MKRPTQLVSELLRPQQLDDLTLPRSAIHRLRRMVELGTIMNMVFHGEPGLWKDIGSPRHHHNDWRGRL